VTPFGVPVETAFVFGIILMLFTIWLGFRR
jgi:hypothetical protein